MSLSLLRSFLPLLMAAAILTLVPTGSTASDQTACRGGRITVGLRFLPRDLDPRHFAGHIAYAVSAQLFASPIRFDAQGRPAPYLAERWEVAANQRAVTLHLRKGARFSDGSPITAEDVAFSLREMQRHHVFRSLFSPIEVIETPSPLTVVIRLAHPHPALMEMLSPPFAPVFPRHVQGGGKGKRDPASIAGFVGSGPFIPAAFEPGRRLRMRPNPRYFLTGRPFLDELDFRVSGPDDDLPLALINDHVQLTAQLYKGMPGIEDLFDVPHLRVIDAGLSRLGVVTFIQFNLSHVPTDDLRVRRAIAYAIDRKRLLNVIAGRRDAENPSPLWIRSPFFTADVAQYDFDPQRANRLLDEAGYPRDENGRRLSLRFLAPPYGPSIAELAAYLRDELLRTVGIDLQVEIPASLPAAIGRMAGGDFDIAFEALVLYPDPIIGVHRSYHSRNIRSGIPYSNETGFRDPLTDRLLDQAARETDPGHRKALYVRFQQRILDQLPVYPLSTVQHYLVQHRDIEGLNDSDWGLLSPYDQVRRCQVPEG